MDNKMNEEDHDSHGNHNNASNKKTPQQKRAPWQNEALMLVDNMSSADYKHHDWSQDESRIRNLWNNAFMVEKTMEFPLEPNQLVEKFSGPATWLCQHWEENPVEYFENLDNAVIGSLAKILDSDNKGMESVASTIEEGEEEVR